MNKKKVLIGVSSVFVIALLIATLILTLGSDNDNVVYQTEPEEKEVNQVGGFLTLMLETGPGTGEYQESTSGSWPGDDYIFNKNMSACENGGELSWDSSTNSVKLLANSSDACYIYFDKRVTLADVCSTDENLSECIINYYNATGDMDNGLYYHDADLANGAEDYSYRYAGANPNNYVCFGDDCSNEDNLYRIIGVFGSEVKLIKNTSIGYYVWDESNNTNWNATRKPSIYTTLDDTYYNSLEESWQNKIATNSWEVGGATYANVYSSPVQTVYNYEVGAYQNGYEDTMKIGLMYVSDYGYAASRNYWAAALTCYNNAINSNWMYLDSTEWTISRFSDSHVFTFSSGCLTEIGDYTFSLFPVSVRPVFYLKENVTYVSGDGSKENPIRIDYKQTLTDYVMSQYTGIDGDNGLYYHDADLANGAGDNSYRYAGSNQNNYVCFGSDAATCPSANLYRIIGVFDNEVKLIKSTNYGNYVWNSEEDNTWNSSTKPDIRTTLNSTYLNTLSSTWQNKIAMHSWKVGGGGWNDLGATTAATAYENEVGTGQVGYVDSMKVGLMYVSDYGFAASNNFWSTDLSYYGSASANDSNWMYLGSSEWTISRGSDQSASAFFIYSYGVQYYMSTRFTYAVRPAFYLTSTTTYISGSGTSSDSIRIN